MRSNYYFFTLSIIYLFIYLYNFWPSTSSIANVYNFFGDFFISKGSLNIKKDMFF